MLAPILPYPLQKGSSSLRRSVEAAGWEFPPLAVGPSLTVQVLKVAGVENMTVTGITDGSHIRVGNMNLSSEFWTRGMSDPSQSFSNGDRRNVRRSGKTPCD